MGLFSNIRSRFRRKEVSAPTPVEIVHEVIDELADDDLEAIWEDIAEDAGVTSSVDAAEDFKGFALDTNVMELFRAGWVDMDEDTDTLNAIREEFFDLMSEYDISEDTFDWDAWRDWYKD